MRLSVLSITAAALLAAMTQTQAASYAIDPLHTFVSFEIGHLGTSTNRGRFDNKEGAIEFDRGGKSGAIKIVIYTASVNTGAPAFAKKIQSEDVLDSVNFPTATFAADKLDFTDDKLTEVTGTLTLHGKTNPITLKATNFNCYQNSMLKREVCGGDFETTIDRTQYGIDLGVKFGISKDVRLLIQVEAIRQ